ncbi:metallophosphoesterase [Acidisoma sp. L85]|uniref:metallophosphoesterase family protein n=1 Tax=Acidisoma sp. L85 TaxID=1641850 RepID=UPI00131EA054|nr:metallophosphoesterase [Acidisoma sp. L85]
MPIRIIHLSDLHYGGTYHDATWRSVAKTIAGLRPQILVVSGDLVDDPRDDNLKLAKHELDKLADDTGATLLEVPGNHDLFPFGLATRRGFTLGLAPRLGRLPMYEDIFHPVGMSDGTPDSPGFQPQNRGSLAVLADRTISFLRGGRNASRQRNRPDVKARLMRPPTRPPRVEAHGGVLFALIDSNAVDRYVPAATGRVSRDDLTALDQKLEDTPYDHLARVAVIHHHLLPVMATGGKLIGSEALMVLHNAGDVLGLLARHRFDLVLHGHKHRAQFCRVDFEPETPEGHQIAVVSAGSAAIKLKDDEPHRNSFNLVTIEDDGRIAVESYHYGSGGKGPNPRGVRGSEVKLYEESFQLVRQRAFTRSSRRHPVIAARRELQMDVEPDGTLIVRDEVSGLCRSQDYKKERQQEIVHRPQVVSMPSHGRLARDLALDATTAANGFRIEADPCGNGDPHRKIVVLPEPLNYRPTGYAVTYACANSMNMTMWEAAQRATFEGGEPDNTEWVGGYVSYPVEEFTLSVRLPKTLADVRPRIRCHRRRGFPGFEVSQRGNAELPDTPVRYDEDTGEAETSRLVYDRVSERWSATIRRPMVGYRYRIYWPLPNEELSEGISGQTQQLREALLGMVDRAVATPRDDKARSMFALLAEEFRKRLGSGMNGESTNVSLFVYDPVRLAVRPVFWEDSLHSTPGWKDFVIPLGDGIAGACFLQRRPIPWESHADRGVFVRPVPLAGNVSRTMLAIPVFHRDEQDKDRPSPLATIGVLSFGSSDLDTKVPDFFRPTVQNAHLLLLLRAIAQGIVYETIEVLRAPDI